MHPVRRARWWLSLGGAEQVEDGAQRTVVRHLLLDLPPGELPVQPLPPPSMSAHVRSFVLASDSRCLILA